MFALLKSCFTSCLPGTTSNPTPPARKPPNPTAETNSPHAHTLPPRGSTQQKIQRLTRLQTSSTTAKAAPLSGSTIRFNELINALEALPVLPEALLVALQDEEQGASNGLGLASLTRAYAHGGAITKYEIGEALAELTERGLLGSDIHAGAFGRLAADKLGQARKDDPALNLLFESLLKNGQPRAVDSPLAREIKESHSEEYMRLCSRSSRRPAIRMPGVDLVISELADKMPFAGVKVFQAQHGFDTDEAQARSLMKLGLEPANLSAFFKTGARALVIDRLERMGVEVYDNPVDLRTSVDNPVAPALLAFLDRTFGLTDLTAEQQVDKLRLFAEGSIATPKTVLVDEGFKIGQALLIRQQSEDPLVREKYRLLSELCPMVAHTEGDIIKGNKAMKKAVQQARAADLPVPVLPRTINMAQSPAKKLEGVVIGHDVWLATNQLLASLEQPEKLAMRPKEALVIGYGAVSARSQPQLQDGYEVWIWDISAKSLANAYAHHEAVPGAGTGKLHIPVQRATAEKVVQLEQLLETAKKTGNKTDRTQLETQLAAARQVFDEELTASKEDFFGHGHMVIGNTGDPAGSLRGADFGLLPDGALLSSGASGDYEFGKMLDREENPHLVRMEATDGEIHFPLAGAGTPAEPVTILSGDKSYYDHQVYKTSTDKQIMLLRGGYVANRLYGTPPEFIDVTKSIMLRSMYEASLATTQPRPDDAEKLWLVDCDVAAQNRIIATINKNLAEKNLGSLDDPDFNKIDLRWHRPAEELSLNEEIAPGRSGYTLERFVQSGLKFCETFQISPLSFALLAKPEADYANDQELQVLQKQLFTNPHIVGQTGAEVLTQQRNIAHVLHAVFAIEAGELSEGKMTEIEARINNVRVSMGIDDQTWEQLLHTADGFGLHPAQYAILPQREQQGEPDVVQKALVSLQDCMSLLTIKKPTREQLLGNPQRRQQIAEALDLRSQTWAQGTSL